MRRRLAAVALAASVAVAGAGCNRVELQDDGTPTSPQPAESTMTTTTTTSPFEDELSDTGVVGLHGRALLSKEMPRAVVEIDSSDDAGLSQAAVDAIAGALREHGGKAVSHAASGPPIQKQDVYTSQGLRRLSREHRDSHSGGDTVGVYVLVLAGRYENEDATGVAFEAGSFAIFPDRLRAGLLAVGSEEQFETAVALHELGHLFGLVNLTGEGAFHEDPEHPGHSASRDSVMYWAIETISIGNVFRDGPPTTFDDADRQEMENVRQQ